MIPAWSDQAHPGDQHRACCPRPPASCSSSDLGLPGGFSRSVVLANGVNKDAALKLADFILTEEIQSAVLTELGGFPGVSWDYVSPGAAREVQGRHPRPRSRSSPAATGRWRSTTAGTATSRRTWTAASDAGAGGRHRRQARSGRWPIGLLLVAPPGLPGRLDDHLADHLGDHPHPLAARRRGRRPALLARDLRLLLLRRLQPQQPRRHALDHRRLRRLPACRSACRSRSTCASPTAGSPPMCRASPSSRCSCPRSSSATRSSACSGPNGTVDLLLNAVGLPKIRIALPHPLGAGDRPRLGQYPAHRADPALRPRRRLQPVDRGRARRRRRPAARCSGTSSCRASRNSILVAISFTVLGIFSAFTLPYVLGPAAPEMMGPFMQRTFRDLNDPDHGHHPGGHHLRLLHRVRALLRALRRQEPGAPDGSALATPHRLDRHRSSPSC